MKTNQLKSLVGKLIQWEEYYCPKAGHGLYRVGRLIELRGRNLLVDQMGSLDWKWLPNMLKIKSAEQQE